MARARHVRVTLRRAKNINACTVRKARTMVFAKASHKNLLYTTNMVEDMGQNPAWEDDGTNVFHFDFEDESEYVTVELFNRNNDSIGLSRLLFSKLGHLLPGGSEVMTLTVIEKQKQFGEVVLLVEIMAEQAMGELGLLKVELRKGIIPKLTSTLPLFGSKTTKISAKVIYKHTTRRSGVLEKMGNKFVWHEDNCNTFTFIINSIKPEDLLKIEVYNINDKVGECEMLMSLFIEENPRGSVPSELVTQDLCLPNRAPIGKIEVAARFIRKPIYGSSFPQTQHLSTMYPPSQDPSTSAPYCSPTPGVYPPEFYSPPAVPQFNPSVPFNPLVIQPQKLYPPGAGRVHSNPSFNSRSPALPPEFYPPPVPHFNNRGPSHLHPSVSDQTNLNSFSPSAPEYYPEVVNHHSRGASDTVLDYQHAHGAPARREEVQSLYRDPELDEEMKRFMGSFH